VLILTPASLVGQWQGELEQKFFERFDTPSEPDDWLNVTKRSCRTTARARAGMPRRSCGTAGTS